MDRVNWTAYEQFTADDGNRLHSFPQDYFKNLATAFSGDKPDFLSGAGPGFDPTATGLSGTDLVVDIPAQWFGGSGLVARQPDETLTIPDAGGTKKYWIYFVVLEETISDSRVFVNPLNGATAPAATDVRVEESRGIEVVVTAVLDPENPPLVGATFSGDPSKTIIGVVRFRSYTYTSGTFPPDSGPDDIGDIAVTPGFATLAGHAPSHVDESGAITADPIPFSTNTARGTMPARSLTYVKETIADALSNTTAITVSLTGANTGAVNPGDGSDFILYGTGVSPKTIELDFVFDSDFFTVGGSGLEPYFGVGNGWGAAIFPLIESDIEALIAESASPPIFSIVEYFNDFNVGKTGGSGGDAFSSPGSVDGNISNFNLSGAQNIELVITGSGDVGIGADSGEGVSGPARPDSPPSPSFARPTDDGFGVMRMRLSGVNTQSKLLTRDVVIPHLLCVDPLDFPDGTATVEFSFRAKITRGRLVFGLVNGHDTSGDIATLLGYNVEDGTIDDPFPSTEARLSCIGYAVGRGGGSDDPDLFINIKSRGVNSDEAETSRIAGYEQATISADFYTYTMRLFNDGGTRVLEFRIHPGDVLVLRVEDSNSGGGSGSGDNSAAMSTLFSSIISNLLGGGSPATRGNHLRVGVQCTSGGAEMKIFLDWMAFRIRFSPGYTDSGIFFPSLDDALTMDGSELIE